MVTTEKVIISIDTVADIKKLVYYRDSLLRLGRQGVDVSESLKLVETILNKTGIGAGKASRAFRRFKYELLGTMFWGMQMQQLFGSMLAPAEKLTNQTEIWGDTIGLHFLPGAMAQLDWTLKMDSALTSLNTVTGGASDQVLGIGAVFGRTAGDLLQFSSNLGLTIVSLKLLGSATMVAGIVAMGAALAGIVLGMAALRLIEDLPNQANKLINEAGSGGPHVSPSNTGGANVNTHRELPLALSRPFGPTVGDMVSDWKRSQLDYSWLVNNGMPYQGITGNWNKNNNFNITFNTSGNPSNQTAMMDYYINSIKTLGGKGV